MSTRRGKSDLMIELDEKDAWLDHAENKLERATNAFRDLAGAYVRFSLQCPCCRFEANQPISLRVHLDGHLRRSEGQP